MSTISQTAALTRNSADFDSLVKRALANDGKVDAAEAEALADLASKHVWAAKHAEPTLELYNDKMTALVPRADVSARSTLEFWGWGPGSSIVTDRAQRTLTNELSRDRHLRSPLNAIALNELKDYEITAASDSWEPGTKVHGGIEITDNAADGNYLLVKVDATKLPRHGRTDEQLIQDATRALDKYITQNRNLMYSGASYEVVLVKPSHWSAG